MAHDLLDDVPAITTMLVMVQREVAERVKQKVNASGKWKRPVVTEVVKASDFWTAEDYHQDYLIKNPGGYTCHYDRGFKFE